MTGVEEEEEEEEDRWGNTVSRERWKTRSGTWWMRMEQNENCRGVEKRVTK